MPCQRLALLDRFGNILAVTFFNQRSYFRGNAKIQKTYIHRYQTRQHNQHKYLHNAYLRLNILFDW